MTIARKYRDVVTTAVEDLAAGADITERAFHRAPAPGRVEQVHVTHRAAAAGIDGSNTAVITLRNITKAMDVATVTLTTNPGANSVTELTITSVNAAFSKGDVFGVVVTQGALANLGALDLHVDCNYGPG